MDVCHSVRGLSAGENNPICHLPCLVCRHVPHYSNWNGRGWACCIFTIDKNNILALPALSQSWTVFRQSELMPRHRSGRRHILGEFFRMAFDLIVSHESIDVKSSHHHIHVRCVKANDSTLQFYDLVQCTADNKYSHHVHASAMLDTPVPVPYLQTCDAYVW